MMLLGNINAIPFRRRRFGGGDDIPFPSIPGMIARYSAKGLTNEEMSKNPVWKDLMGNGHDLQMKNFGWAGMSGVNGYEQNYKGNRWTYASSRADIFYTGNFINVTSVKINSVQLYYQAYGEQPSFIVPSYSVKVSGLMEGQNLDYRSSNGLILNIKEDGIYRLPEFEFSANGGFYGFQLNKIQESCNITIEQLPLYPGALVFDGVDDYGVCDNFPVLTKEKGYTVVALRQWIEEKNSVTALASNSKNWNQDGAFVFEYNNLENDYPNIEISFGSNNMFDRGLSPYSYQTSKSYNGNLIKSGSFLGSDKLVVAKANENLSPNSNIAIWELVFLDHDATEEELTKIKDYFVKTYPWLFPDQAWTVVGKTNEDEDRATIANITGNGNNLVLSNSGFAEGSGYGLYAENYAGGRWVQSTDRADLTWTSYSVNITSVKVASTQLYYQSYPEQPSFIVPSYKIKVYGLKDGQTLSYRQATSEGQQLYKISEDGTYTLPSFPFKANGDWCGFTLNKVQESCDITIEQIPEYEGYLVTDGVDDKITSSTFEMGNDWTVIGDWELINTGKNDNAGIVKFDSIVIYNYNPILINIKNGRNNLIPDQNTVNAICSDGRIYSKDWKESIYNEETESTSKNLLTIGYSGNRYTKIAFKNLAIYPTVLSKEDCIKAYNYLQTLKAK